MGTPTVDPAGGRLPKPMYVAEHASASVIIGRFRNAEELVELSPTSHFNWMHRFYFEVDKVVEQHGVYKLYGGPDGFMLSTGVAEPDEHHAANLLRAGLQIACLVKRFLYPSRQERPDLVLALASGPLCSGLLGSASLTYQVVGRAASVAQELVHTQLCLPFMVTRGTRDLLPAAAAAALKCLGRVPLRCCGGQEEELWGLPDHAALPLTTLRFDGVAPALPASEPLGSDQRMEEALPSGCSTPDATVPTSPPPMGKLAPMGSLAPLAPAPCDGACDDSAPVTPPHTANPAALSKALDAAVQQRNRAAAQALFA